MDHQPPAIPDLSEKGRDAAGQVISVNRRLFMELLAFTEVPDVTALIEALQASGLPGTLYVDIHDARGVGLLTWSEQPDYFITTLRNFLQNSPFADLTPRPGFTMLGRSYSIGYEADLEHVLFKRPISRATNPATPWHVWYPLRRKGSFEKLPPAEQKPSCPNTATWAPCSAQAISATTSAWIAAGWTPTTTTS
jgi:hypothetical protein